MTLECENWIVVLLTYSSFFQIRELKIQNQFSLNLNFENENAVKSFLAKKGFSQLIENPTHDKGHIIDHVYVNKELKEKGCFVTQESVHFSDHDMLSLYLKTE